MDQIIQRLNREKKFELIAAFVFIGLGMWDLFSGRVISAFAMNYLGMFFYFLSENTKHRLNSLYLHMRISNLERQNKDDDNDE